MGKHWRLRGAFIGALANIIIFVVYLFIQSYTITPCPEILKVNNANFGDCSQGFLLDFNARTEGLVTHAFPYNRSVYDVTILATLFLESTLFGSLIGTIVGWVYEALRT
jgi:hypothetical protein